jgi:hypothetical protein
MLKKIVFFIFIGVVSTVAIASSDETQINSTKSNTIVNAALGESFDKEVVKVESNDGQVTLSQGSDKGNTILPGSGWLLGMALFGFVLLSNRSSI